ncbi:MAG: diguanylate cyclase, partial [Bacilli bacterium]
EKLSQANNNKNNCTVSICFVDINGLKEVNDSFGHDTGDEFLIVFSGITKDEAEVIWNRIQKYYDEVNKKNDKKYVVSASHGIETFFCNSQKRIDDIINDADEKMYIEKKEIKKNLSIIKQ